MAKKKPKFSEDMVVGGKVVGNKQARLQCQAGRILVRVGTALLRQTQGYSFFTDVTPELVNAARLIQEAKLEQWRSFEGFVESCMKEGKRKR